MVAKVYKTALGMGTCKGITVYRDGSGTGVLVSADSPGERRENDEVHAKGKTGGTGGGVIWFKNANEQWIAFVGPDEGRPYEGYG